LDKHDEPSGEGFPQTIRPGHRDVAYSYTRWPVPQDEKVTSVEGGTMDSEMTHITGYGDAVKMERPFHALNGVLRLRRTGSILVKRARIRKEALCAEEARFILGSDLFSSPLLW